VEKVLNPEPLKTESTKKPLVSVVVLTCNGRGHLEECLGSLLEQTWPELEIILVDNGSRDGSAAFARERFGDRVRVLELEKNLGYTGGNNRGIAIARGEYVCLLNDDTRAAPGWVEELLKVMTLRGRCGLAASKILSYYDHEVIDNVGHVIYRDGTFRGRGRLEKDRGQYDRVEEILSPSGCAMMLRKSALDEAGGFDEDFYIYGDDAELSLRLRLAGWEAWTAPAAVVYHKYSASTGAYSPLKAFLVERNRVWLTVKYFPPGALALSPFFLLWRLLFQAYGVLAGKGAAAEFSKTQPAWHLPVLLARAQLSALKGLPKTWKKRRRLRPLRRVPSAEFYRWLRDYGMSARELALKS